MDIGWWACFNERVRTLLPGTLSSVTHTLHPNALANRYTTDGAKYRAVASAGRGVRASGE